MTILATGSELDSFDFYLGAPTIRTAAADYDSAFARSAIGAQQFEKPSVTFTASSDVWLHFRMNLGISGGINSNPNNHNIIEFVNSTTGKRQLRIWTKVTDFRKIEITNDQTTWTEIADIAWPSTTGVALLRIDIHFRNTATGIIEVYIENRLVHSSTGDYTTEDVDFDTVVFGAETSSYNALSEVIVADVPTIGWALETLELNAAGTYTEWFGVFSDVNAVGTASIPIDYFNTITTNATSKRFLANIVNMSTLDSGREILGVATHALGTLVDGSVPTDMNLFFRSNGVDYTGVAFGLTNDAGFIRASQYHETDPNTGVAWLESRVNGFQVGVTT